MSVTARSCALLLFLALAAVPGFADTGWAGRTLVDIIAELSAGGLRIIYSSELLPDDYRVRAEPAGETPRARLGNALRPYELALADGPGDSLLIVRAAPESGQAVAAVVAEPPPLAEIVVTSSRYDLRYESPSVHTFLDRDLTAALPDVGDEPLRALWRLPGTASGGVSTRHHVRGGERNEQLFLLDGLRLYEPYHLKDFQQVATIVDQSAIAGIDFFSGGFPARYGDRMSGVVEIELREPPAEMLSELGFSLFNASLLSTGRFAGHDRGDWLLSARRGNLDLLADIVNPDYGSPRYEDFMMRVGWRFGPRIRLSASWLYSFDRIRIAQPDEREAARAKYRNSIAWLKAETDWSDSVTSETILSITDSSNDRSGSKSIPGLIDGSVDDSRDFQALALAQRVAWHIDDDWSLAAGVDLKRLDAEYRYDSTLAIAGPFAAILDNVPQRTRSIDLQPSGAQYAAWLDLRWQPIDKLVLNAGLRWDQQTYTTAADDRQFSPRLALLYRLGERTDLRLSGGQYYQAQEINELQVGDGVTRFFPAQRSRHTVASLAHRLHSGIELRLEAYQKDYSSLMPRFENVFNSLVLIPELQIDRVRIDVESARARGVELTVSGSRRNLLWWAGYVYASVEDRLAGATVPRSWDQRHSVKAGVNWDWQRWRFSAAAQLHSGWPATSLSGAAVTLPDGSEQLELAVTPRNSLRYGPFHSLDVRVSRRLAVRRGELDLFLEISNLYNRKNPCCNEYRPVSDADGAPLLDAGKGYWLPLVPSLGVLWRF